jgi:hypothetical protein
MNNFENLVYTYKHRKVLMFLAKKYFDDEELIKRIEKHDLDKMYLLLFYDKKSINKFHRSVSSHHDNDLPKTELDYEEMVLDWESARYTKEDKPLNAFDTMNEFYPHLKENILPILERIGWDYSTLEKDEEVVEFVNSLGEISEESIKRELTDFINL